MEFGFDIEDDFPRHPLDEPMERILSLAYQPFDDFYQETLNQISKEEPAISMQEQATIEFCEKPLMVMVPSRPTLPIEVAPFQSKGVASGMDRCKDYPKYMANRIIDMLYVRTDIQDKLQRRKSVTKYCCEDRRILNEQQLELCCEFLDQTKRNHNFLNIRVLFGLSLEDNREQNSADVFRVQSHKYFASDRAAFDFLGGEMLMINKLSVLKRLQRMCDMCINPFEVNSLNQ